MTDSGILYCVVFKDPPNRDPVFSWVTQGSQGLLSDPGRSFVTGVASLSGAAAEYVRKSPELSRGKSHASVAVPLCGYGALDQSLTQSFWAHEKLSVLK